MMYRPARSAGLVALAVAITGCGTTNTTVKSRVRVVNAITGTAANVDVTVNGVLAASNLTFGAVTPASTEVNAGASVPVSVTQTGTSTVLASNPGANVTENADVPILVTGTVGSGGATAPTAVALSAIDLSSTPSSSQPRIYFVNAAPGAGSANFTYQVGGGTVVGGVDIQSVAYEGITPPQFPQISGGVTTAFTATVSGQPAVAPPASLITGGHTYLVVLMGVAGSAKPLTLVVLQIV